MNYDHFEGNYITNGTLYIFLFLLHILWWVLHPGSDLRLKIDDSMGKFCQVFEEKISLTMIYANT